MSSWVELPVEGLLEYLARLLCRLNQLFRFVRIRCERLFQQYVLSRLESFVSPFKVEAVRRGNVDNVYFRIVEEVVV